MIAIDMRSVRYVPTWFPGAKFKRDALSMKADVRVHVEAPYNMVKEKMVNAHDSSSAEGKLGAKFYRNPGIWCLRSLRTLWSHFRIMAAEDEDDIKSLGGMIFGG
jgi:hypothetical protein